MNRIPIVFCMLLAGLPVAICAGAPNIAALGNSALGMVESGNIDAAADELGGANLAARQSLAWYQQSSVILLGWAEQLRAAGEFAASERVAAAAIRIMLQGVAKGGAAAKPADQAQLYVQLAAAYDHFLGDRATARQYYQWALQAIPDLPEAKAGLARYDADDKRLRQFVHGGN